MVKVVATNKKTDERKIMAYFVYGSDALTYIYDHAEYEQKYNVSLSIEKCVSVIIIKGVDEYNAD